MTCFHLRVRLWIDERPAGHDTARVKASIHQATRGKDTAASNIEKRGTARTVDLSASIPDPLAPKNLATEAAAAT